MIGLLDLGGRGLVRAAIERSEEAVVVLPRLEAALASIQGTELDALVVETDELDAGVRELLFAAGNRLVPTLVVSRDRSVNAAVDALRSGATDYLCSPFEYETLQRAWSRLLGACGARPTLAGEPDPFVTNDPETRATLELARSVAASDATILIEGESGTGKELLARLIHRASPRRERPLVSVNCAALPAGLLESELFGHERGAFTGAVNRVIGKFELARSGSWSSDSKPSCCGCSRRRRSSASAPPDPSASTSVWSSRPTAISPRRYEQIASGRTFSTGCRWFPSV
jgi:DNA-binding NtrC family response regulator